MKKWFWLIPVLFFIASCSRGGFFKRDTQGPMTYTEDRSMGEVIESLVGYLKERNPDIVKKLNPAAEQPALDQFEKLVGRTLPQDFRVLYLTINGQDPESLPMLLNGYRLLSLEEIELNWRKLKNANATRADYRSEGDSSGPVRAFWWYPMWIPFAKTAYGDYYCFDLFPARGGKIGQIIEFRQDTVVRRHLGFSMSDFLGEYEKGLKSGKYSWDPEYSMFLERKHKR